MNEGRILPFSHLRPRHERVKAHLAKLGAVPVERQAMVDVALRFLLLTDDLPLEDCEYVLDVLIRFHGMERGDRAAVLDTLSQSFDAT